MKVKFLILVFSFAYLLFSSCSSSKNLLLASDAEAAIKELLSIGAQHGGKVLGLKGAISKENLMSAIFPEEAKPIFNTLQTLGFSTEVNRFTETLGIAAENTAQKSVPIFLIGIKRMNIKDAISIVKNGGTAATDYLRKTIGDTLRNAITPVMNTALDEYKLANQWNNIVAPTQLYVGNKINLSISNLMSGLVANLMFNKIAEKEVEIRTKAAARTTSLLQQIFSKQ